jgi:hypothetical protein
VPIVELEMRPRLHYDDAAWEKSEEIIDAWVQQLLDPEVLAPVGNFLVKHHRPDDPILFDVLAKGAFNILFKMTYKNTSAAVIRFPQPGAIMFPEEKLRNEVAIMRYIRDKTSIPIPFIYHWGNRDHSPLKVGPFIIMDCIEYATDMYDLLNTPGCPNDQRGVLDPNINEATLQTLYGEAASILLQLSQLSLPQIGSLHQIDDFTWQVASRPLSRPMNDLIRLGSLPQSKLPKEPFHTTPSYFEALAELHLEHLIHQRNDAILSAEDCRRKFVARYLFRKLARERKLTKTWSSFDNGPFKIWCDDLRPTNFLMDENLKLAGVIDWEFTYAAPVEFSYAPPWWLLIEKPEYWPRGLDDWCMQYDRRLQPFLKALIRREDDEIQNGRLMSDKRLSGPMEASWRSGDFWVVYAAMNNFAFDSIYWQKIDQRFFGSETCPFEDVWQQRLDLLGPEEREEMEKYVALKVEELESKVLAWDPDEYTLEFAKVRLESQTTKEGGDDHRS